MNNKKIFDITSNEIHDEIVIGKYNLIIILIESNIKLLNDVQCIYKVYYSIFNSAMDKLYKNYNDYKEFFNKDEAIYYYNKLKIKLSNSSEDNIQRLVND